MSRPALHALLNGTAALLLVCGWRAIRGGAPFGGRGPRRRLHARLMTAALATSAVFLGSYLQYHGEVGSVPFWGTGALRSVYFAVLVPHTLLAVAMLPAIFLVVRAALREDLPRHRRLARWTLPVWIYVSVTGVLVWLLNHGLRPPAAP